MDLDQISITEALFAQAVLHDGIDESNIVLAVRHAQAIVMEYTGTDNQQVLHNLRHYEEVDSILIMVTQNGYRDIFFD